MIVLLVIILVAALVTGSLWSVLEVAFGVALGLFLFVAALAGVGYWLIRRRLRELQRDARHRYPERRDYI